jgi:hypothetical protein
VAADVCNGREDRLVVTVNIATNAMRRGTMDKCPSRGEEVRIQATGELGAQSNVCCFEGGAGCAELVPGGGDACAAVAW